MSNNFKTYTKDGISVTTILHSVSSADNQVITLLLEYPRIIHADFLRHRMLSHSVSSSRAIPTDNILAQREANPFVPTEFLKNQSGMTAGDAVDFPNLSRDTWESLSRITGQYCKALGDQGVHKQWANRPLETFTYIRDLITATDLANLLHLRTDSHTQPELITLAKLIKEAVNESTPNKVGDNDWHLPFMETTPSPDGLIYSVDGEQLSCVETAKEISASLCAQTSYRIANASIETAKRIGKKLFEDRPVHASPAEHLCTPMSHAEWSVRKELGGTLHTTLLATLPYEISGDQVSKMADQLLYSNNFKGWHQHRKFLQDETIAGFKL